MVPLSQLLRKVSRYGTGKRIVPNEPEALLHHYLVIFWLLFTLQTTSNRKVKANKGQLAHMACKFIQASLYWMLGLYCVGYRLFYEKSLHPFLHGYRSLIRAFPHRLWCRLPPSLPGWFPRRSRINTLQTFKSVFHDLVISLYF